MGNKDEYQHFINKTYVPIYSQPWWLDAICGQDNWNVWLYETGGNVLAAMPYYFETRGNYRYITKAPLTQNNGIIFYHSNEAKESTRFVFEEKVINEACSFLDSLNIDVYEQQFQTTFTNWLPFFWNYYECIVRYTYVFRAEALENMDNIWLSMDKKKRKKVSKGIANCHIYEELDPLSFYNEVEKTFQKQGLKCPFSFELWNRLYEAVQERSCGKIIYAKNISGEIVSVVFLVWDEKRMYQLISGGDVTLQHYEGKSALVWYAINLCSQMGLTYDFEGSVIQRISKSNRLFGAEAIPYFRIRKVFNPEIIRAEAEQKIQKLSD